MCFVYRNVMCLILKPQQFIDHICIPPDLHMFFLGSLVLREGGREEGRERGWVKNGVP